MILLNFGVPIKGTSKVQGYEEWIEIDSMDFSTGRHLSIVSKGAERGTSTPVLSEMRFNKKTDIASSELFMQSLNGDSLKKAEIHFLQTAGRDKPLQMYLKLELTAPIVCSYHFGSSGERPSEAFALHFTQISYQFNAFDGDKVKTGTEKRFDLLNPSSSNS